MGLFDRALDGDEGSVHVVRGQAKIGLAIGLAVAAIMMLSLVWAAVGRSSRDGLELPGSLSGLVILLLLIGLYNVERYRRRKLEERVAALEAARK